MEKVSTQIGTALTADFEENTWTFLMPENYKVWAGEFAIVDKPIYDELLKALQMVLDVDKSRGLESSLFTKNEQDQINNAIKKATA